MAGKLQSNLKNIQHKIQQILEENSELQSPRLIAVSKKQSMDKMRMLYALGIRDFAENYLQEAQEKIKALSDLDIRWHYVGRLQTKKIKDIVGYFCLIHSVARLEELLKISSLAKDKKIIQEVLLQFNIADEETKQGLNLAQLKKIAETKGDFPGVRIKGLMIFPPPQSHESVYAQSRDVFKELKKDFGEEFQRLSMGTSHDFEQALTYGATDLRLGEILMGKRK